MCSHTRSGNAEIGSRTGAASTGATLKETKLREKQLNERQITHLPLGSSLSAAFCAAYGFTGAFGRNLCKFTFPQRRRNLRKSLLLTSRPTGVIRAKKWLLKITLANA